MSVVPIIYEAETKLFGVNNKHVKRLSVVLSPHSLTSLVKVDHVCPFCFCINSENWTLENHCLNYLISSFIMNFFCLSPSLFLLFNCSLSLLHFSSLSPSLVFLSHLISLLFLSLFTSFFFSLPFHHSFHPFLSLSITLSPPLPPHPLTGRSFAEWHHWCWVPLDGPLHCIASNCEGVMM